MLSLRSAAAHILLMSCLHHWSGFGLQTIHPQHSDKSKAET